MNFKVKKSEQFKINEYDICNVMSFLQSILFKDMDLKLEFFEAAIIVKKITFTKENIKCDKQLHSSPEIKDLTTLIKDLLYRN